jgi:Transposase DDE domain
VFVRVKSTPNSPRRSVQVVESARDGDRVKQRIVRHMGIALDAQEEAKLRLMAEEFIARSVAEQLNAGSLFESPPMPRVGRPPRQTLSSVASPEQVRLADVSEVARRVEGPHEVLGHLFDYLHFDQILGAGGTAVLRDMVIARVMAPGSKRDSAAQLDEHYGRSYALDRVYRMMDALHKRLDRLKQIVLEATVSLTGGSVQVMLFDITTLYFESVDVDVLRAFGYSKDQKYHCTQVVLALATDEDGLPIGYELFPGNTAEVKTLLACMQQWQKSLKVGRVSFVADRALCSKANLVALEAAPWNYVVAMPLRRSLKAAEQAQVLQTTLAAPCELEGELVWVREFDWQGRRLIVTYSSKRAHKDRTDRQALLDRLSAKLGPSEKVDKKTGEIRAAKPNAQKLITNSGYLRYVEQADAGGTFVLDEDKIAGDAAWDGLHAIVTNDRTSSAKQLLAKYRRLWVIEESFRTLKHGLAVRPIYHFKPERIAAHIGLCYLAFALTRHAQQRIKLAQTAMSLERIHAALHGVQASVLQHKTTQAKYRMPSAFGHEAARIYKAFGLTRKLDVEVDLG